jgi:hypothetical protein
MVETALALTADQDHVGAWASDDEQQANRSMNATMRDRSSRA